MVKNLLNFLPFVRNYFTGIATIFMLHRVDNIDLTRLSLNENMKISPNFLEKFIVGLKSQKYQCISLDRLYEILINGEPVRNQVVFTLDDGYRDNYDIAYQIFKKHNVPFTIYVTTSFPEYKANLWWYTIEDLILQNDTIVLPGGVVLECLTTKQKEAVFLKLRSIILKFKVNDLYSRLNELFSNYAIDWFDTNRDLCMSWSQIKELAKDDLCTIGGHTKNHYPLNQLTADEIKNEVIVANNMLEKKINQKIEHFAYPFGTRNEISRREFNILKNFNFKTITTTRRGTIYPDHKDHLECLPRIMLTEDFNIKEASQIRRTRIVTE